VKTKLDKTTKSKETKEEELESSKQQNITLSEAYSKLQK
jgi:hypothetical protein